MKAIPLRVRRNNVKRRGGKRRAAGHYKFVMFTTNPDWLVPNMKPEAPSYSPYYNHTVSTMVSHLANGNKGKMTMSVPEGMAVPPSALTDVSTQAGKKALKVLSDITGGAFKPDGTICVQSIIDRSKRIGK